MKASTRRARASRLARLYAELLKEPFERTSTGPVTRLYRGWGIGPPRFTARSDLEVLAGRGLLNRHGPDNARSYSVNHAARGWGL